MKYTVFEDVDDGGRVGSREVVIRIVSIKHIVLDWYNTLY